MELWLFELVEVFIYDYMNEKEKVLKNHVLLSFPQSDKINKKLLVYSSFTYILVYIKKKSPWWPTLLKI